MSIEEDLWTLISQKRKRIEELEAKLEEVEGQYAYECECNKQLVELQEENKKLESYNSQLRENYEKCIDTWKQENAKLQEQLKLACEMIKKSGKACVYCKAENCDAGAHCVEQLMKYFEAEAQKYLEEHK